MRLGVDYYPEHWPEERWATDARLMRDLGLQVVRLAEFAWAKLEPAEGQFDWSWLDRAIDTLSAAGLEIILGTPTAAPPAWLVAANPEILPVDAQGRRRHFGGRRHYCVNSPTYREHTRRIVTAMAEHYAGHPHLIGWQIDNEWGGGGTARCYCPACEAAFRRWLQRRYGSLEALNAAWATVFWSQTYTAWEQIDAPILTGTAPNPSQLLDYERFATASFAEYQQLQIDLLRAISQRPAANATPFITHNFIGHATDLDYFRLAAPLDFVSWDNYPTGNADRLRATLYGPEQPPAGYAYDVGDPLITGFIHDLMRGLKNRPFWIMEQQPGHINWGAENPGIRPGTVRLWTWHAVAAGAEAVLYFRWRACRFAQEQYHAGLLRHDATPDVGYEELRTLQTERPQLEALAAAPLTPAPAALLFSYEDLWAWRAQPHRPGVSYLSHLFVFYRALQQLGFPVDLRPPEADLTAYPLILAPTLHLENEALAAHLIACAEAGATVLLGIRSGFKTPSNLVTDRPLPGVFRALTGATVTAWQALPSGIRWPLDSTLPGLTGEAAYWAEALRPLSESTDTRPTALVRYASGPYTGQAALLERELGAGRVLTLGWYPTLAQAEALITYLASITGVEPLAELPAGLIAARRGSQTILLNFTDQLLTAQVGRHAVTVPPRDVKSL